MKNPYDILGVSKNASDEQIKSAYRKLVMKHHPDKNSGDKVAEEKFKEINNAFDVLKDPQKKAAYDRFGDSAFAGANGGAWGAGRGAGGSPFGFDFNVNGFDMGDMMDEVLKNFGFGGGASRRQSTARGRDLLHEVVITLDDAYFGKEESVKFESNVACEKCGGFGTADGKQAPTCSTCSGHGYVRTRNGYFATERPCSDCNGLGRKIKDKCNACDGVGVAHKRREINVRIPAGVADGARLRLQGQGEAAPFGGGNGDFYIDVHIRPHPTFHRVGRDLAMTMQIPFQTLALGGEVDVTTIDNRTVSIKIPSGTQIGEKLRLRGCGMPGGDLYIEVKTFIPTKLSKEQKEALGKL